MDIDAATKVKIAKNAHKGKQSLDRWLSGWKGEETDKGVTSAPTMLVNLLGVSGLGMAIAAIILTPGGLVLDITGGFLCFFAPYMVYQKHVLRDLGSFRSLLNELRTQINHMIDENDKLSDNVKRLMGSVDELEKVEDELSSLVGANQIDRLVEVVKETKEINEKIKKNTKSAIVQQLITTVLRSDKNQDLHIGKSEIENLMTRFEHQQNFTFDRNRFIKTLGGINRDVPIEKIMEVVRNLKDEATPVEEQIFQMSTGSNTTAKKKRSRLLPKY